MTPPATSLPPCVLHEDEHLLVVNKPPGWNTHAPDPFGGEGIYDWLRAREPRWASLGIVQRLDKETSGVMVFTRTRVANQSLARQWEERAVAKEYAFLTDRPTAFDSREMRSALLRDGERYRSAGTPSQETVAVTRFERVGAEGNYIRWRAVPLTGRTHQIRVHAAELGIPILGDTLYGGTLFARVCLHAERLRFAHPAGDAPVEFAVAAEFDAGRSAPLRRAIIDPAETTAFRLIHGAADGWPGFYADRLGEFLLTESEGAPAPAQSGLSRDLTSQWRLKGHYHKRLDRRVRQSTPEEAGPAWLNGGRAPQRFEILENGVCFEMSFEEGYSTGLFLDQRDNRRRLLRGTLGAGGPFPGPGVEVLNTFAYTCGFSVAAAMAGARVTSLDLSRKYLDWGRRNLEINGLRPPEHDFIFGDTFDWLGRLARKGRRFGLVLLDPPTFSQAKNGRVFRAEKDYAELSRLAAAVITPGGWLFASTNAARLDAEAFQLRVNDGVRGAGRAVVSSRFQPQPPDFPVTREEPAHLKTLWLQLD